MKHALWLCVAVLALLAPTAAAQATPGLTVERYQVDVAQAASGLDVEDTLSLRIGPGFGGNVTILVPRGLSLSRVFLESPQRSEDLDNTRWRIEPAASALDDSRIVVNLTGDYMPAEGDNVTIGVTYHVADASTLSKGLFDGAQTLLLFVRPMEGSQVFLVGSSAELMPTGDGAWHASIADVGPGQRVSVAFVPAAAADLDLNRYVWAAAGAAVGLFLMYFLVKRGWVTIRRDRKFEKGGAMESTAALEARRRTLMAALKELEVAHDAKQIPDDAYAPLKEEYKAQAVRVLRSLEGKGEKPKG